MHGQRWIRHTNIKTALFQSSLFPGNEERYNSQQDNITDLSVNLKLNGADIGIELYLYHDI